MNPKVAVPIGRDTFFCVAELGCHDGVGDRAAGNPPANVTQLASEVFLADSVIGSRLPEHAADQKHLGSGSVAAVGFEHYPARALGYPNRPGNQAQDPSCCSCPALNAAGQTHDLGCSATRLLLQW